MSLDTLSTSTPEGQKILQELVEKPEISEVRKILLMPALSGMFEDGVNIRGGDTTSYNALKGLVQKYFGITLCEFKEITDPGASLGLKKDLTQGFTITIEQGSKRAYIYPPEKPSLLSFSTAVGYIENGNFIPRPTLERALTHHDNPNNNTDFSYTPPPKPPEIPQPQPQPQPPKEHTVKQGESLWKIVKREYGLSDNRDIANAVNAIVKFNPTIKRLNKDITIPPDGVLGDFLRIRDIIILPSTLHLKKGREAKRIDTLQK